MSIELIQKIAIVFGIAIIPLSYSKVMLYKRQFGAYTFRGFHALFLCVLVLLSSVIYINYKIKKINLAQHNQKVGWALAMIEADYEKVFGEKRDSDNQEYFVLLPSYYEVEGKLFDRIEDYI